MEEAPVAEVGPMEGVTMYETVSAAMEYGRRTKAATVDRHPTTSETAAVKGRAATAEAATMKGRSAAAETTATTAAETTTATAAETAAAMTAMLNLGRQPIDCKFC
jgi:hypothetical protein